MDIKGESALTGVNGMEKILETPVTIVQYNSTTPQTTSLQNDHKT